MEEEEKIQTPMRQMIANFTHKPLAMTGLIVFLAIFVFVMIGPKYWVLDLSEQDATLTNLPPSSNMMTVPEEMLKAGAVDCIMACGPTPMLRAVQKLALQYEVEAQLSLEEHMGCGIGACLTCNCKVKAVDAEFGYKRVCADGPVLDAKEVIFG